MNLHHYLHRYHWHRARVEDRQQQRLDVEQLDMELDELRERVDQLAMVNRALWEILRDELQVGDERLSAQLEQMVERRQAEGAPPGRTCGSCGRVVPRSREHCLYCGV